MLNPKFDLLFNSSNSPIVFFHGLFNKKLYTFQIKRYIYANGDFSLFMYEGSMKDFVCKMGYPLGSKYEMEEEWDSFDMTRYRADEENLGKW